MNVPSSQKDVYAERIAEGTTIAANVGLLCVVIGAAILFTKDNTDVYVSTTEDVLCVVIYVLASASIAGCIARLLMRRSTRARPVFPTTVLAIFAIVIRFSNALATDLTTGDLPHHATASLEKWGRDILKSGTYHPTMAADATVYNAFTNGRIHKYHDCGPSPNMPCEVYVTLKPTGAKPTKLPCVEFEWPGGFQDEGVIVTQEPLQAISPRQPMPAKLHRDFYYWYHGN